MVILKIISFKRIFNLLEFADEIYKDLASPTDLSIPAIAFWIRSNIGGLNNHIHTSYVINADTLEIEQTKSDSTIESIGVEQAAVLKKNSNLKNKKIGIILTGGNVDLQKLSWNK